MTSHSSPTVRQLAAWAGVSIATISRALHNHPSIPLSTRKRIQRLAKEKGYQLDPVVGSLMTALRTKRALRPVDQLAFLISWPEQTARTSEQIRQYYLGASERASEMGYELVQIFAKEKGMTAARLSRLLYTRAIRGLILAPLMPSVGHVSLEWDHFSAVAIGYTVAKPLLHRVAHNHFGGMETALRRLHRLGYRRIGFVTTQFQHLRTGRRWLAAFMAFQSTIPKQDRVPHLLVREWNPKNRQLENWLEKACPDVVLGDSIKMLQPIQKLAASKHPDMGFAALDLIETSGNLSGIDQRPHSLGYAAADMLVKQLQQNEMGLPGESRVLNIEGVWHDGTTTCRQSG
jgi:LacI family transcriptional regulator